MPANDSKTKDAAAESPVETDTRRKVNAAIAEYESDTRAARQKFNRTILAIAEADTEEAVVQAFSAREDSAAEIPSGQGRVVANG